MPEGRHAVKEFFPIYIRYKRGMIDAGVVAMNQYLFEGYQVFDADLPRIVESAWVAMCKAASNARCFIGRPIGPEWTDSYSSDCMYATRASRFDWFM